MHSALCLPAAVTPLSPFPPQCAPLECSQRLLQAPIWMLGQETALAWLLPRCTAIPARICVFVSMDQKKYTEKKQLQNSTVIYVPEQKGGSQMDFFHVCPSTGFCNTIGISILNFINTLKKLLWENYYTSRYRITTPKSLPRQHG